MVTSKKYTWMSILLYNSYLHEILFKIRTKRAWIFTHFRFKLNYQYISIALHSMRIFCTIVIYMKSFEDSQMLRTKGALFTRLVSIALLAPQSIGMNGPVDIVVNGVAVPISRWMRFGNFFWLQELRHDSQHSTLLVIGTGISAQN